jgi:lysophospholipase L1-like esterase
MMRAQNISILWLLFIGTACFRLDSYAALGDSYATGAGAGEPLTWPPLDARCGRFAEAYPRQIVKANKGTVFRNLACGGSSTTSVLLSQVPWIEDSQVITLTIGGNEVDFFEIVNDCVFEWVRLVDCEAAIARSRSAIESEYFRKNLERLIKAIVDDMAPEARLLVTGYAKFFNEKTTQCDRVSFSRRNPENTLTRARRADMNDLLRLLNNLIRTTAVDNGAEYVNFDAVFEAHRFCEEGVVEPDVKRNATWFLTSDRPSTMTKGEVGGDKSLGIEKQSVLIREDIPEFAVFHPTTLGQRGIAEAIMKQLEKEPS